MVMYVKTNNGRIEERHVNDMDIEHLAHDVRFIQADGHELKHIENMFKNLPSTTNRVVSWYGEMAQFIAYNLK